MNALRFSLRITVVVIWILLGLIAVIMLFPFFPLAWRSGMNRRWSLALMRVCGVRIVVQGRPVTGAPVFWVANHVSWVDIFVLNTVRPTAFVAKSDIRRWPVIGWLVAGAGTVFIERRHRQAILAVGEQMKRRFARGEVVGLFPEGTTSPGFDVADFHSSLFEAAIRAGVDIQPVALRFFHRGERSDYVSFVGEQNLVQNLWCLLGTSDVAVEAVFLEPVLADQCLELGRTQVAACTQRAIRLTVRGYL